MVLITIKEIIYLLITTAVVGYIFSGFTTKFKKGLDYFKGFDFEDFKLSILVASPGIILHELMHKFVAMFYGLSAQYYISVFGLIIGSALKFFSFPFIILAPGYVGIVGSTTTLQSVLISFAGPFTNLVLWISSYYYLKHKGLNIKRKTAIVLFLTKEINKWLFIFNMLPIPPLDGSKVWFGLFDLIF